MSYLALARKWRPRAFADMVGQTHVLKALTSALSQQRLHHAYLFTGTRGVGKTTIARIFAKSLNCELGVSSTPCGQCSACIEVDTGRFIDLIEVDAASRTKVEDTRDLLENVQYAPTRGRYKIYLIDEVHMLSTSSFNALLKTLEEPPPHVKFLLATTDPQKLPITVLSRCLQFHLKALTSEQIVDRLKFVLTQEAIEFDDASVQLLARAAEGSLRDALSLLDQAIAHGQGLLRENDVRDMLGFVAPTNLSALVAALTAHDVPALMHAAQAMEQFVPDYSNVLAELLSLLHGAAVLQQVPNALYKDNVLCQQLAEKLSAADLQLYYQTGLLGRRDLPLAPSAKEGFEMTLLRMLAFRPFSPSGDPQRAKTPATSNTGSSTSNTGSSTKAPVGAPAHVTVAATAESTEKKSALAEERKEAQKSASDLPAVTEDVEALYWFNTTRQLALSGLLSSLINHTVLIEKSATVWRVATDADRFPQWTPARITELQQRLQQLLQHDATVKLIEGVPEGQMTPAQVDAEIKARKLAEARVSLQNDPIFRDLIASTNATVIEESLRSLH